MATNPDRASFFPAIEKKHGQPMTYWFGVMDEIKDRKYPEQMAYLQENYGFSRAHANALVLYSRGNTTSRRFNTVNQYLAEADPATKKTVKAIFKAITDKYPDLELVIAWNHPMLRYGTQYVFGVNVLSKYLLIAPATKSVLDQFRDRLKDYKVNQKTIQVPLFVNVGDRVKVDTRSGEYITRV